MKNLVLSILFIFFSITNNPAQNFVWAENVTAPPRSIAADASGNMYLTGNFTNVIDLDPGAGTYNAGSPGSVSIYISKLDAGGNFIWARVIDCGSNFSPIGNGTSITLDAAGNNVLVTGSYGATIDFDPGIGSFPLSPQGNTDIFVLKLDAAGSFVWAKSIGGTGADEGVVIRLDASDNVYTTGQFLGTVDFDPGAGVYLVSALNNLSFPTSGVFISKLDANGNFVWAKSIAGGNNGSSNVNVMAMAVDAAGNVHLTGNFSGSGIDFDPGAGAYSLATLGIEDIFIEKLNASGNFVWMKRIGSAFSSYSNYGFAIAVDASGSVYTSGNIQGTSDFDPGPATYNLNYTTGGSQAFVSKLDAAGNFVWAKAFNNPGNGGDVADVIALDVLGNVYTGGLFSTTNDFDPGAGTYPLPGSGYRAFMSKLSPAGNFIWAGVIGLGNSSATDFLDMLVDGPGNIYASGVTFASGGDFDPGVGTYTLGSGYFIEKLCNPQFPAFIVGPSLICSAGTATAALNYSVTTSPSTNGYVWTLSQGAVFTSAVNTASVSVNLAAGPATLAVTFANFCGASTNGSLVVNVGLTPTLGILVSPSSAICLGSPVTLTGSGASTYTWSNGITNNSPFTPTATSVYTVTGSDAYGCRTSKTTPVIVYPLPVVGASALPSVTVCAQSIVTLGGTGAASYTWTGGVMNAAPFVALSSAAYTVTGIDANGCVNTGTIALTVNPVPDIILQPISQTLAINNTAQFVVACSDPGATLQWYKGSSLSPTLLTNAGQYSGVSTPTLTVINLSAADTLDFYCVAVNGDCSDTSAVALLDVYEDTGFETFANATRFRVFPNPAGDLLQVQMSPALVGSAYTICDQTGRIVLNGKFGGTVFFIDLSNLSKGLYLMQAGGFVSVKIAKQ